MFGSWFRTLAVILVSDFVVDGIGCGTKGNGRIESKALTTRSKHVEGLTERYLLGQKHNLQIFGVIPFVKLQNDI